MRTIVSAVGTAGVAASFLFAAPAQAAQERAPEGQYVINDTTGATFSMLNSNSLFPTGADDDLVTLSTAAGGARRMPFPVRIYGVKKFSMVLSTNGNLQFFSTDDERNNVCLPTGVLPGRMIAVLWDDLTFSSSDGEGVFTRTSGAAPNRKFTVSWQGHIFGTTQAARAQVVFFENSTKIRMVYGAAGGGSATVGVQAHNVGPSRQWTCNSGTTTAVTAGLQLDFLRLP